MRLRREFARLSYEVEIGGIALSVTTLLPGPYGCTASKPMLALNQS